MKKIFRFLLILTVFATCALAQPEAQSIVLTPRDWRDVNKKIEAGYIRALGSSLTATSPTVRPNVFHPLTSDSFINILFIHSERAAITSVTDGSSTVTLSHPITLSRGIYVTMGVQGTRRGTTTYTFTT